MKDFIDKSIGERDGWFLAGIRRGGSGGLPGVFLDLWVKI